MKHYQIVLVVLTMLFGICVQASVPNSLPQCALKCMNDLIPQSDCSTTNQTCICANAPLQEQLTACVTAQCTVKESLTTQNVTATTCDWPYRDQAPILRDVSLPLLVLATIFVAARIIARLPQLGGSIGSDDYMVIAAWVLSVGFTILIWMMSYSGLGKDVWTVPFDDITETLRLFTALEKVYIPTVWITKISILLLYLRLFPDYVMRRNIKIGLALCSAAVFCLFWACVFKCWPISFSWTYWDGEHVGKCSSMLAQGWANSSLDMFADIAVLLLPLPTIWKLRLSLEKKLSILSMFSVGFFVTVVSMVRFKTMKYFTFSANPTRDFVQLSLWSAIEIYVGIICACMPGMRALFTRVLRKKSNPADGTHGRATPNDFVTANETFGSGGRRKRDFELMINKTNTSSTEDLAPSESK